jgi:hypothetical protein
MGMPKTPVPLNPMFDDGNANFSNKRIMINHCQCGALLMRSTPQIAADWV